MIKQELLDVLVCPENRTRLRMADASLVEAINAAIRAGRVVNRAGKRLVTPTEGGLMREDGAILYPVHDGIPIMLVDEGIALDQL